MKTKLSLFSILLSLLLIQACKEKEPEITPQPRGGILSVNMKHEVNGKPIELDKFLYMTQAGDSFQVTLLQYFVSNFEFHSPETGWKKMDHYQLVRLKDANTFNFDFEMPFGNYDSLRFYVGLDSAANHDIDRVGDLDAGYGMIWTWNSGYIFYMFEGKFVNKDDMVLPFAYHIGGDSYLLKYELPIASTKTLTVANHTGTIDLRLELDEIFKSPTLIDLNTVPLVSHTFDEPTLSRQLMDNLLDAFTAQ